MARRVEGALEALMEDLLWLSLDQGPAKSFLEKLRWDFKERLGLSDRLVMFLIRVALTSSLKGSHLATVAALLGQERCVFRVQCALGYMSW